MDVIKKMDVLNALACLKAMCASYDICSKCPAYNRVCMITYTDPCDYELNVVEEPVWRAFK